MRQILILAVMLMSAGSFVPFQAQATVLLDGMGGDAGYGDLAMGRNDDDSSDELSLPFTVDFYGNLYTTFYINNNGNITFNDSVYGYTPEPFPVSNQPMIAPYWGDVDTSCGACGEVYVGSPNAQTVVVTWDGVGFYSSDASKTNTFQLVLKDRSDTGDGNFDVEFRYDQLEWTTGDASDGTNGLGGTPAQVGYDAGDGVNFFTLPGSFTAAVLDLTTTSNTGTDGVWSFAIRNGELPGSSPDNPLMPVVIDGEWNFDFNIGDIGDVIFIDPAIAIGYEYIVDSGPNFQTVLLPTGIGDDVYDLWLFNEGLGMYVDSGTDILGGVAYDFGLGGLAQFLILGIELGAGLDPADTSAFVTGLTFVDTGPVHMRQIPLTEVPGEGDPGGGSVPEPGPLMFLGLGFIAMVVAKRRRRF